MSTINIPREATTVNRVLDPIPAEVQGVKQVYKDKADYDESWDGNWQVEKINRTWTEDASGDDIKGADIFNPSVENVTI